MLNEKKPRKTHRKIILANKKFKSINTLTKYVQGMLRFSCGKKIREETHPEDFKYIKELMLWSDSGINPDDEILWFSSEIRSNGIGFFVRTNSGEYMFSYIKAIDNLSKNNREMMD